MSSILHHVNCTKTGRVKPVGVKLEIIETDAKPVPSGFGVSKEYVLKATLSCSFWANQAQYEMAKEQATKVLNQALYKKALSCIAELRSAAYSNDTEYMLSVISDLEREIGL